MGSQQREINKFHIPKSDRNDEIVHLRHSGVSFTDIAKQFGISSARVRDIYERAGRRAAKQAELDAMSHLEDSVNPRAREIRKEIAVLRSRIKELECELEITLDPFYISFEDETPLNVLKLSSRAQYSLYRKGINTVGKAAQFLSSDTAYVPNFGKWSRRELLLALNDYATQLESSNAFLKYAD